MTSVGVKLVEHSLSVMGGNTVEEIKIMFYVPIKFSVLNQRIRFLEQMMRT